MKIGLVAVDGGKKFPNLALGKLSAWHKSQGDSVEWADPMFGEYDMVYMSKIFNFTPPFRKYMIVRYLKAVLGMTFTANYQKK